MFSIGKKIWQRLRNSLIWATVLVSASFALSILVYYFESNANSQYFRDFSDLYWWWVSTVSGSIPAEYPITIEGGAIATSIILIGLVLLGLIISEMSSIIKMIYARYEEGNINITYKNHIVIFGYTSLTAGVIKLLRNSFGNKIKLVLISNDTETNPFPQLVDFIHDNPINHNTLTDANVSNATAAIILANDRFRDPDTYTLAIAASIEAENSRVVTVAEITNPESKDLFKIAKVDAFLDRHDLVKDMLEKKPHPKLIRVISKETVLNTTQDYNDSNLQVTESKPTPDML